MNAYKFPAFSLILLLASMAKTIAQAPDPPIIDRIADDTGISNSDFITNDQTLGIAGRAYESGLIIEVFLDGSLTPIITTLSRSTLMMDGTYFWSPLAATPLHC